jgi:hypothetical protein
MTVGRASGGTSLIDVLDRVLDKGIVSTRGSGSPSSASTSSRRRGAVELYQTLMRRFTLLWRRARRVRTA